MADCCRQTDPTLEELLANERRIICSRATRATKFKIKLDLPSDSGYLATYWPGQKITGQLAIHLNKPVNINHLHIVLFGHIQVYGDYPGHPLSSGLFDHVINEQLAHTGVRVTVNADQQLETSSLYPVIDNKIKKTSHDRYIESLIKQVATIDHHLLYHQSQCSHAQFRLTEQSYSVNFSIRVPSRTVHSFEHPHTPIMYWIVAFMQQPEYIYLSSQKIRIESFLQAPPIVPIVEPAYYYTPAWFMFWKKKSPLNAYVSTPDFWVERGDFLPLTIKIESHELIGAVSMRIRLIQRLLLMCSLNEEIDHRVIQECHVKNEVQDATVKLPRSIQVPKECECSIDPTSTRDIVSLEYDVAVQLTVESYTWELNPITIFVGNKKKLLA